LEERVDKLESDVNNIHERNKRAEKDKAREISWWRRGIITLLTYVVIVIYFFSAGLPDPFVNSVVPAVAFVLATMTLPWFQKIWEIYLYDPEKHRPHGN
jgi:hypothetical protein